MTKTLTIIFFILTSTVITFGQNTLSGKITDSEGESLPFANVMITHYFENGVETPSKTQIGTTTDLDGDYILTGIRNGKFNIKVIYLGFEDKTFQVDFSGEVSELTMNIALESGSESLDEIIVTSQAKGQMKAINQQINSLKVVNVVSADRIQQNPDANAAEAIGRLPGVTVTRSGGEANGIVVRGMQGYHNTTVNGVEIPVNLTDLSQYALQNVEVFKSVSADMDAASTAGTVNLKLGTAPNTNSTSILTQGGYSALNNTFDNYKFNISSSWRFLDKKLGVSLNLSTEATDRSAEILNAGIGVGNQSVIEGEVLKLQTGNVGLTDVDRTVKRNSAILTTDYRFSPTASIEWSNIATHTPGGALNVSHNYSGGGSSYSLDDTKGNDSYNLSSILTAKHLLGKVKVDYSASFGYAHNNSERRRTSFNNLTAYDEVLTLEQRQTLSHIEFVALAPMENTSAYINEYKLTGNTSSQPGFRYNTSEAENITIDTRINMELPYTIGGSISGNLKWGGRYKHQNSDRETYGVVKRSAYFPGIIMGNIEVPREDGSLWNDDFNITPEFYTHNGHILGSYLLDQGNYNDNFLNEGYNFGWYPNMDRVNEILNWYDAMTDYAFNRGQDYWTPIFRQIGHLQRVDFNGNALGTSDYSVSHSAGYIMTEIKIGNNLDFVPGVRYENYHYDMNAWHVKNDISSDIALIGESVNATHDNEYFLPMVQLKYKPLDWLQGLFSYTETLQRPGVRQLQPWVLEDHLNLNYSSGNPNLKPEQWTNIDFGVAVHGPKIGLFSVTLFYKEVEDKINNLNWTKLSIDTDIELGDFKPEQRVDVVEIQNHPYEGIAKGIEVEWQTNFLNLPKPFNHFTLNLNYSYTNNKTTYVYVNYLDVQVGTGRGDRPIYESQAYDELVEGPMTNMPSHLFNATLGFSYKKFSTYLSYQYIGEKFLSKTIIPETDLFLTAFSRFDLQATYKLPVKGLDLMFSTSNFTDTPEIRKRRGDDRPTRIERYGLTADLGLRFRL